MKIGMEALVIAQMATSLKMADVMAHESIGVEAYYAEKARALFIAVAELPELPPTARVPR